MRRVVSLALCMWLCAPVPAVSQSRLQRDCEQADLDRRIKACTAIIGRGKRESAGNLYLAHANRGMAYLELENFDSAIADLSKAIAYEPKQPLPYAKRGEAYARKRDLERAVADYSKSLEILPDADTYSLRAQANMDLERYDDALEDYGLAITYGGGKAKDHIGRGRAFLKKKEPDRAIEHLDRAIEIDPKSSDAYDERAEAYWMKDDRERFRADLQTAIKLLSRQLIDTPSFKVIYGLRGHYHLRLESYGDAIADFSTAYGGASSDRALAYSRKGDFQRALADLADLVRKYPDNSIADRQSIGYVRFDSGDFKGAAADLRRALERQDDYPTMLYLFLASSRAGEPGAAAELEANAGRLKAPPPFSLAIRDLLLGRTTAAAALALAKGDERCAAHFLVGEWQIQQGDTAAAERNLQEAADICHWDNGWRYSARFELARLAKTAAK